MPKAAPPPPPVPPKQDPTAAKLLDQAIEALDPRRLGWLGTDLWQQLEVQGVAVECLGKYLSGPQHRRRLEMRIRLGDTQGEVQIVSDGASLWYSSRIEHFEHTVTRVDLNKIFEAADTPGTPPAAIEQLRDEFFQRQSLSGLAPLLKNVRDAMTVTSQEPGRWQDRDVIILTGVWSREVASTIGPVERWPPFLPRTCRIFLDKQTLWPCRLEWRAPSAPNTEDALVLQMEFRNPQLFRAEDKPPESMAKAFTFDAGSAKVDDQTKAMAEMMRNRAREIAPPKKAGPAAPPGPGSR